MLRRFISIFLLGLAAVAPLRAADAPSLEERLRALEAKVDTLEKENTDLRRALGVTNVERLSGATAPASHNSAPADAPSAADRLMPAGKETRLALGGYSQAQAEFGGTGDARYVGTNDRFYFRRARINLAGNFAEHFEFKIEGEFGAGANTAGTGLRAQMNDTYLGWNFYPEATVRIGQLKAAFSAELLAAEFKGPLMERSIGAERIGDGRQLGIEIAGEIFAHRAGYSYAEISEQMGVSHITIKRHIARALLAIMEYGEPDDDGAPNRAAE